MLREAIWRRVDGVFPVCSMCGVGFDSRASGERMFDESSCPSLNKHVSKVTETRMTDINVCFAAVKEKDGRRGKGGSTP